MTFEEFSAYAHRVYDEIPEEFKEGLDGMEVTRKTELHPNLPEVYTLGECLSEFYPSDFGGPGEVLSRVVLYYGSFLELSRSRDDWDWEDEVFETVTHEVRHHLEHLASEDALEEMDYAEDQNFARREGERFDPFFFRMGEEVEPGVFEVDGDIFVEMQFRPRAAAGSARLPVQVRGTSFRVGVPANTAADVSFLRVVEPPVEARGDLLLVLVRRRGWWQWLTGAFAGGEMAIEHGEVEVE
jgi:predicted Zn-dependent protease with MMP-like domain